jgi:hypothetical protein
MTRRLSPLATFCAVQLLGGIAAAAPAAPDPVARMADISGSGTLSGQAFLTAMGGEHGTCAGREVTVMSDDPPVEAVQAAGTVRRTICDTQDHFAFEGLGCTKSPYARERT